MPYRYLHCIASVDPRNGGPVEGLRQLAATNARLGHEVEVASLDAPDAPWARECPVPCHALGPGRTAFRYAPRLVPWLRENRGRFDCVIVNGLWLYNGFGAWRALRGTDTPYFVFTHGMLDPWFKRAFPLKHLKKWMFWPWSDYRVLRDARAVFFTSEEERRAARESFWLYRCREHVVKYGTSGGPEAFSSPNARAAFESAFPELAGKRNILFFGRVHPKKGPDLLIRAAAALRRRGRWDADAMRLVMAGPADSDYAERLRLLARAEGVESLLHWTGMLAGPLKWGALANAEAFVLPSHQENFGIAVAEALSAGVPVLISNRVNIWREIEADGAGWVDEDTQAGTERLLERWLGLADGERDRMRRNAKRCFAERFHIDQAAASLVGAFRQYGVRESLPGKCNG